ncbi:MAG: hypothetical protein HYZ50_20130 [Deltaproteobacteria bacterium]|nr:hypothetical protein [Deltaproteobacteria bacterium]
MTQRQIRKSRRQIEKLRRDADFGAPQRRAQKIDDAIRQLQMLLARLGTKLGAQSEAFRVEFEKWTGYTIEGCPRPELHPEAHRKAQLYNAGAFACTAFEAALAAFICSMIGLPWWVGVVGALLLVVIFHAGFNLAFDIPEEPTKTYANLRKYLLVPALSVFALAILSLLFSRSVPAHWVLEYEAMFNLGLWATSVSLILLGGALWSAAHIQGWSGRMSREYDATERLQDEASRAIAELQARLEGLKTPASKRGNGAETTSDDNISSDENGGNKSETTATVVPSKPPTNLPNGAAVALSLLLAWAAVPALAHDHCPSLDLYLDHSGSLDEASFADTLRTLSTQLPTIVEQTQACELRLIPWSDSAPTAAPAKSITLPQFDMPPSSPTTEPTEMCKLLPKCLEEKQKKARQAQEERKKAALQAYRDRLKEAFDSLHEDSLLPSANGARPRCSDLQGILGRIATSTTDRPRRAVLVSDGHHTCGAGRRKTEKLEAIPRPTAPIELAIILVPEKGKAARHFEKRQSELRHAVSWAHIYLSYQSDFDDMFSSSVDDEAPPLVFNWKDGKTE